MQFSNRTSLTLCIYLKLEMSKLQLPACRQEQNKMTSLINILTRYLQRAISIGSHRESHIVLKKPSADNAPFTLYRDTT
jgi:hypothetical protein